MVSSAALVGSGQRGQGKLGLRHLPVLQDRAIRKDRGLLRLAPPAHIVAPGRPGNAERVEEVLMLAVLIKGQFLKCQAVDCLDQRNRPPRRLGCALPRAGGVIAAQNVAAVKIRQTLIELGQGQRKRLECLAPGLVADPVE